MPRNVIDISASKKFGKHWEIKLNIRDLLTEKVNFKQFAEVKMPSGENKKVDEIVRQYRPGRNIGLSVMYKL